MGRPEPQDDLQRLLLKLIFERFQVDSKWSAFIPLDREFHRRSSGRDILDVARTLPDGLLRPPIRLSNQPPQEPFQLTLAGVVAATEFGGQPWDQSVFLNAVRLAAEIETTWEGSDEDPDALPVLTANDVVTRVWPKLLLSQLPDILSDPLIKRVGYLLSNEPMNWRGAHRLGESDWSLTIDREIRHYAELENMDTYWAIKDRRKFENEQPGPRWSPHPAATIDHRAELQAIAELQEQLLPLMLELSARFAGQIPIVQAVAQLAENDEAGPPDELVAHTVLSMQTADLIIEVPGERGSGDLYPTLVRFTAEGQRQAEHVALQRSPAQEGSRTPTDRTTGLMDDTTRQIFIVHGHDHEFKYEVATYIRSITGTEPTILHEKASGGSSSIIEKLEEHGGAASFAIVLLTPDDFGGAGEFDPDAVTLPQRRARQNVVFEMGWFFGKLSRKKVVVINGGVEKPSDYDGILYIPREGQWRDELRKELGLAGFSLQ